MKNPILSSIGILAAACVAAGCQGGAALRPSTAAFTRFTYSGADDAYVTNPLPTDSSFYNPVLPGWYSDPTICRMPEGQGYLLATSTFGYFPGVPLFHSHDLVNWTQTGHILTRESQLRNLGGQGTSGGIFAPDLKYCPWNDTYYMITTNVGWGNFYVKAADPFGEWSEPVRVQGVRGIDPSFFFDEQTQRAYIVNNDDAPGDAPQYDGHRTIRIREVDLDADTLLPGETILVDKGWRPQDNPIWIEGPHMYRIGEWYYLMSAEGGTGTQHSEVIFRSHSPWGPFVPWPSNPMLTQRHLGDRPNPVTCAGHADLVQAYEGDWWAVFLATRPMNNDFEILGRETFMMPVQWTSDGWPYMTQGDDIVPLICQRQGAQRADSTTFGNFTVTDEFRTETLGMEWLTLRGPGSDLWSLTENPGSLTLRCAPTTAAERGTPAFVARRVQHHRFTATTSMAMRPAHPGDEAGLLLYKDENHHLLLCQCLNNGRPTVAVWQQTPDNRVCLTMDELPDHPGELGLRIEADGPTADFLYSTDGGKEWRALLRSVSLRPLSTAEAGGFTGAVVGPYAAQRTN